MCIWIKTQFKKQEMQGFHLIIHLFYVCKKLYVDKWEKKITVIIKKNKHTRPVKTQWLRVIFVVEKYTYSSEKHSWST